MPETEAETAETEVDESVESTESSTGDTGGVLTDQEQETLQEWIIYAAGIFVAIGGAIGLNSVLQSQWEHTLVFYTGSGVGPRVGQTIDLVFMSNVHLWLTIAIPVAVLTGVLVTRSVPNENQTAFKVAGIVSLVGLLLVGVVSGLLGVGLADDFNLDLINTVVSSLASGVAAAIGSLVTVYLTDEWAPESFSS